MPQPTASLPARAASVDPARCPLCGDTNLCGMLKSPAACADTLDCWCRDTPVAQAALDRLPETLRGVACICRRCAGSA